MSTTRPPITGTTSHPDAHHVFTGHDVSRRDTASCQTAGCTVTVTRCDMADLWPWECDHCGPVDRPTLTDDAPATPAPMTVAHPVAYQQPTTEPRVRIATAIAIEPGVPADTHDYVTELVDPTNHYEPRHTRQVNADGSSTIITTRHRVTAPPLLEQLATAIYSTAAEEGRRAFGSKPSARVDALDALQRIESGVESWLKRLGLDIPTRPTREGTEALNVPQGLRRAAAHAPEEIRADVRSWWSMARTVTGWDQPAWKPDNSCPLCNVRGGLRIRRDATSATCVECWETWDVETIGLLAEHIRTENDEDDPATEPEQVGA